MNTRLEAVLVAAALIFSACGSSQQTQQPSGSQPQPTSQSTATVEPSPGTTSEPPPVDREPEPLPEPSLESADEIAEFMFDPSYSEDVVVSMLSELGIGLYHPDGTPIRVGAETSAGDFFVFEPEARGLIDMLRSQDQEDEWMSFRDFHAALAGMGLLGSAEELAQAYAESYAADPDASISKYVNAGAVIDVEAPLTRFTAWLMIADAFAPSSDDDGQTASIASGLTRLVAAKPRNKLGVAKTKVRQVTQPKADSLLLAQTVLHLVALLGRTGIRVSTAQTSVHEGHGGPGPPVKFTVSVRTTAIGLTNPFPPYAQLLPLQTGAIGFVPVTWVPGASLLRHGTTAPASGASSTTDGLGEATLEFTPWEEDANGHGVEIHELGQIEATVQASDIITQVYGLPALGALVPRVISGRGEMDIAWHELEAMRVTLNKHYDVTFDVGLGNTHAVGDDEFIGQLAQQPDGTWSGEVIGRAVGEQRSEFLGPQCGVVRWDATQTFEIDGLEVSGTDEIAFLLTPKSPSSPATIGRGRCRPSRFPVNGILLAPFNDSRINTWQNLEFTLPPRPGDTQPRVYPIEASLPGMVVHDSFWTVKIE